MSLPFISGYVAAIASYFALRGLNPQPFHPYRIPIQAVFVPLNPKSFTYRESQFAFTILLLRIWRFLQTLRPSRSTSVTRQQISHRSIIWGIPRNMLLNKYLNPKPDIPHKAIKLHFCRAPKACRTITCAPHEVAAAPWTHIGLQQESILHYPCLGRFQSLGFQAACLSLYGVRSF